VDCYPFQNRLNTSGSGAATVAQAKE
jgi:hypothetical protein